jgi:hypothetical protein
MGTTVLTVAEIDPLLERVRAAAGRTTQAIGRLIGSEPDSVEILRKMKFTEMAWHPVDDRPLNLIEQLNQTWTYLVTLKALPFLFERHPAAGGFQLNLGTASGTDIESVVPKLVAAEVFAAVHPSNNRKLTKDLKKLALDCPDAQSRYVFFGAPGFRHERQHKLETVEGIEVWGIDV